MENELLKRISNEYGTSNVQIPLKVPEKLNALIENNLDVDGNKISRGEFVRRVLYVHFLPEILHARLYSKATDWVRKEDLTGNNLVTLDLNGRLKQLEEIGIDTQTAIELTNKFIDRVMDAEVEYLNELSSRLTVSVEKEAN